MEFSNSKQAFWLGVRDLLPLVSGVLPFGLITGAYGVALGMNPETVLGMTVLFYAGSAQLIAYQLIQENAPLVIIVLTAVVVNLRFAIYSATFSSLLSPLKKRYRLPLVYMLSDQVYGLCAIPAQQKLPKGERLWYYAGVALTMWFCWILSVVAGIAVGASIPPQWSLEFTIPLAFLAMLVSTITNRLLLSVAIISGISAVLFKTLPYNSGFIVAVICGVSVGLLLVSLVKGPAVIRQKR